MLLRVGVGLNNGLGAGVEGVGGLCGGGVADLAALEVAPELGVAAVAPVHHDARPRAGVVQGDDELLGLVLYEARLSCVETK